MSPHKVVDVEDSDSDAVSSNYDGSSIKSEGSGVQDGPVPLSSEEPIAIIGMACRLPGDVRSASDLWNLLMEKRSAHSKIPKSRWNVDGFYHPNGANKIGTMNMDSGYFISEDLKTFENSFFGINNIEATYMDPQQRKLLEVVYECLENAGVPLESVSGANIGTFVGSFTMDYWIMRTRDPDYLHRYDATGMGTTILSNRISHALNLKGPSFTLDTGCSASLYSLHQACAALDAGECEAAIVAASNLIQSPEQHIGTMKAGVLSPTGICHTFDDTADGYGRADGIGALYLKKLSKAIKDGDTIRSVIRGTAVNSNGKTPGISLPSSDGQEAVIRKAYRKAGLNDFSLTEYVECHGTGTPVGDPIEVEGVARVFQRNVAQEGPLLIGSVKTNLGHSEATSGLSSLIKATLTLENGRIPATIGIKNVNPKIKTEEWGVKIVTETTDWPLNSGNTRNIRRIGINSFGYGGANSHAILDAATNHVPLSKGASSEELSASRSTFLIPLSASTPSALEIQAARLASLNFDDINVVDLAFTLGTRRSKLSKRSFALAGQKTLKEDLDPENYQNTLMGTFSQLPIAFVFTGQGAQWPQMGKELIEEFPSFRSTIQDLDAVLQTLPERPSWTLQQAILEPKETSQISHVTRSQPVCTAIQIAYVRLLAQWGIKPEGVIGHSSGEIGAAYASGRLTCAQAIIVAYYRGYVVGKSTVKTPGAMMAAGLGKTDADTEIEDLGLNGIIKVACVNSPESVTISGDETGIDTMLAELNKRGVFARKLNTNGRAYHSHHMTSVGQEYQDLLEKNLGHASTQGNHTSVTWVSSVYAEPITGKVLPSYWRKNLESPVLFSDALERLVKGSKLHLVELGPHSAMEQPIKQTCAKLKLNDKSYHYSSVLSRGKHGVHCALKLMGTLFLHGHDISFAKVNRVEMAATSTATESQGVLMQSLPPYPWTYEGTTLFDEPRASKELKARKYLHHDLLGVKTYGGDGLTTSWRNTIRVKDIEWIQDHKLGQDIVFPGAGYIAMAIEAICQVKEQTKADAPSLALRHINIFKAFPLSSDTSSRGTETFTTLRPMKISGTTNSAKWYDFEIMSHENEKSSVHCTGQISLESESIKSKLSSEKIDLEESATRNWYAKFSKVGLNFGPTFQTLKKIETHRKRQITHARTTVQYLQGGGEGADNQSDYIIHPLTIDSLLQSALVASTAGVINDLTCKVPTSIESARFQAPSNPTKDSVWLVDAISEATGFGSIKIAAELHNTQGEVFAQIDNCSATAFQGAGEVETAEDRHPMIKILWKPDISKITSKNIPNFSEYLSTITTNPSMDNVPVNARKLAAIVDLLAHKKPRLSILELGTPSPDFTKHVLDILRADTPYQRYASYSRGYVSEFDQLVVEEMGLIDSVTDNFDKAEVETGNRYDLIIFPNSQVAEEIVSKRLELLNSLFTAQGAVLGLLPLDAAGVADHPGFASIEVPMNESSERIILGRHYAQYREGPQPYGLVLVERSGNDAFNALLAQRASDHFGRQVERVSLDKLTPSNIGPKTTVITTIELSTPILDTLSVSEMTSVKVITDNATNIVWIAGGGYFDGLRPHFALVGGFARALMLEQPTMRFFTFDIDEPEVGLEASVDNIIATIEDSHTPDVLDFEVIQKKGVAHTSRFLPEESMNETFRQKQGNQAVVKPLDQTKPSHLTITTIGQFDTLAFQQEVPSSDDLPVDFVEVDVKSVGLNAKDVFVYSGKVDTRGATSSLECAGVITRVGSGVWNLKAGDRVVVMAPGHFATVESFPEWACEKLREDEDFNVVSTLPLVFATAIYGLCDRARLRHGETVLIHSGAGGVGMAAIQIAQLNGAEIFTTVSTEEKKDYLVSTFGIKRENIFNSRDSSFLSGVLAATKGRGVDVVLNSLLGDLLHDSWKACARFGRFVEIGKRDLTDAGLLDMQNFKRNVTFTAFDVSELCDVNDRYLSSIWERLLRDVMGLYRDGKIKAFSPLKVFDASEISQAFRYFSTKNRMGKIAISFENDTSMVKVLPLKYDMALSPDKFYLLAGCLGGIGRSISKWMMKQGARKFIFLGRSALDKEPARKLVEDLEKAGANVQVVRGDVGNQQDVEKCASLADGLIGGVVQASMGLDEHLWTSMSHESWHTSVSPKVQGSWNLHNAIKGKDSELEFFLMTSSVAGSVGTATESNYCAANYFMDILARHRRSKGLPATSIGLGMISQVGYLHENPDIEAVLLRKGIQAITEGELLQIIDISLSKPTTTDYTYDPLLDGHVLTGLETQGMKAMRKMGFEGTIPTLNDPRASVLASALDGVSDLHSKKTESGLPPALAEVIDADGDDDAILEAIVGIVVKRFSNLILVQADKIDNMKPLMSWGMDSMLAAEFRTWFHMAFNVDIPFLLIMSDSVNLRALAELVKSDMEKAKRW